MNALDEMRGMVERIVSEVLESRLGEIRAELVQRVEGELQPLFVQREGPTALLNVAVNAIQGAVSQADILNSVLDGSTNFAGRAILFVMRSDAAVAWSSRGFPHEEPRNLKLSGTSGIIADTVRDASMRQTSAAEVLKDAVNQLGEPVGGQALLLPMKVRDKVPAVLYADSGTSTPGRLDSNALQLLLRSASLWLEVLAGRRGTQPSQSPASAAPGVAPDDTPVDTWRRASDSGVVPERVSTSALPEIPRGEPPIVPAERIDETAVALTGVVEGTAAGGAAQPAGQGSQRPTGMEAGEPGADADVHNRARRFAKLLVDEIVLYNQRKVAEGRQNRDLYDRLRDDIEKSRAAYQKRYGSTAAAAADYFTQELVSNLAANNPELLGSNSRG